jgi:outer membrane protein assembly factor BamB
MADNGHSGFNPAENIITEASAPQLRLKWKLTAGAYVASQPVEANGLIYWGSWDGFEHATDLDNRTVWATNLGITRDPACYPSFAGVTSTATIASVHRNGTTIAVDFVGGGDGNLYALDARTGEIIWKQLLGSPPHYYLWGSPAVYKRSVYIGISSFGDCPLVRGGVVQLDVATGRIQHTFNTVPRGCIGASIWTTPTIDEAADTLYVSTGNAKPCSHGKPYADALVELRASDLSLIASWKVPRAEQLVDGDFGSTPTLFKTSSGLPMVGLENKNGLYYAFQRDDLSKPVWKARIASHRGSISSSAWDGKRLYVAGRAVVLEDDSCPGSLAALNPDTGAIIWQHCLAEDETGALGELVSGAVAAAPGVIAYGQGSDVIVLDADSGKLLFSYHDTDSDAAFCGWASISHGVLYIGSTDGKLFAFAPQ